MSSSGEEEHYSGRRYNTSWVSSSSLPDVRIPTISVHLLPQSAAWLAFVQRSVRCDFALMRPSRLTATMTRTVKTLGILVSHARQADVPPFLSHLFNECEPIAEFLHRVLRRSPSLALKPDQLHRCQTDKLQILVVEPQSSVEPWTSVPSSLRYAACAVEGMLVACKFRRAPDLTCSDFTIAKIHINNECAERRSVCIALLMLKRDLCLKLGAAVLSEDFRRSKGVHHSARASAEPPRWKLPSDIRTFRGPQVALPHCGDLSAGLVDLLSVTVAHPTPWLYRCYPGGHRAPSYRRDLAFMSKGSTSNSQDANAGALYPIRIRSRARNLAYSKM